MDCQPTKKQYELKLEALSLADVLTVNRYKRDIYPQDINYLNGMHILRNALSSEALLKRFLWNHCLLLVRPDAFFVGYPHHIVEELYSRHMSIVGCETVLLTRSQAEALWLYQSNVMTEERKDLLGELLSSAPSVLLLIHDDNPRISAPATAHLTYLKGPSIARKRKPWHLRSIVAPATASILSYLHASDDPADMVREMCLLLGADTMLNLLGQTGSTQPKQGLCYSDTEKRTKDLLLKHADFCRRDVEAGKFGASAISWPAFMERARCCIDYVSGEAYDPYQAIIPDGKDLAMTLDSYLKNNQVRNDDP
ncbi:nucleoside-diphosphate kinase [Methylobacter luteus]|uniref:nucleoside-diphosphate kinase n=1 Tax=Methylobacter luteus TaxID=415 RepID=UPI0004087AAC|nr:nucleoside-diphosphate kinase [Methylobacter luteus]